MYPLELPGPEFLQVYITGIGAALVCGTSLQVLGRVPRINALGCDPKLDAFEIAYLRDRQSGVIDAAIAHFVHRKKLTTDKASKSMAVNAYILCDEHPVTAELSKRLKESTIHAKDMRQLTEKWKREPLDAIDQVTRRLEEFGFVVPLEFANAIARGSAIAVMFPMLIGMPKLMIGLSLEKPVGLLIALLFLNFLAGLAFWRAVPVRTYRGESALRALRDSGSALKANVQYNPDILTPLQITTAAALFGPSVFMFGSLCDFYRTMRPVSAGGSGCGSSSSGCGGGGCGGGGCGGGCGGCGGG